MPGEPLTTPQPFPCQKAPHSEAGGPSPRKGIPFRKNPPENQKTEGKEEKEEGRKTIKIQGKDVVTILNLREQIFDI
jgi:hypothetical protein